MKNFTKEVILAGCGYQLNYIDNQFCFKGDDGMNTDYFTLEICRIGLIDLVDTKIPVNAKHISEAVIWLEKHIELSYEEGQVVERKLSI